MFKKHLTLETDDEDLQYTPKKELQSSRNKKQRSKGSVMTTRSNKIFDRVDGDNISPQGINASSRSNMFSPLSNTV